MTRPLIVTGTSTDVGKTITTAALAAAVITHGRRVAVVKPAQTGSVADPGDLNVIVGLAGELTTRECARYPEPLAPETAARRAGARPLSLAEIRATVDALTDDHDLVLIEGAGGALVRLAPQLTILDVAAAHGADVLVVTQAGLGALNHAELTVEAIRARGLRPVGLVIGSWPREPDLAADCNRSDLPRLTQVPLVGVVPTGAGRLPPNDFRTTAASWFDQDWLCGLTPRDHRTKEYS